MGFKTKFKTWLADDRGQSTTEYILILSVVVMIAVKFKKEFQDRLVRIVGKLGNDIESATNGNE